MHGSDLLTALALVVMVIAIIICDIPLFMRVAACGVVGAVAGVVAWRYAAPAPALQVPAVDALAAETLAAETLAADVLAADVLAAETLATETLAAETLAAETLQEYPGAINEAWLDDDEAYDVVDVRSGDEANAEELDADEKNATQARFRNDPYRAAAGTMRRRRDLDPHLREDVDESESRVWWGRHEE